VRKLVRGVVLSLVAAGGLAGALAGTASASGVSISCVPNQGCVGTDSGQGFSAGTITGAGVLEGTLCLGSKGDPCSRLHGELIFAPKLIAVDGGFGSTDAGVVIVPTLVSVFAGGQSVNLTASNGAVGLVTIPDSGAACVQLSSLSITATPC
jgi:hypothetical protein